MKMPLAERAKEVRLRSICACRSDSKIGPLQQEGERDMSRKKCITRREFLRGVAAGVIGAPYIIHQSAIGLQGTAAPGERVNLGVIGVGERGRYDMGQLIKYGAQVVAICDVNGDVRERVGQELKLPPTAAYNDFRELLERKRR
jgi:hypothetical protein